MEPDKIEVHISQVAVEEYCADFYKMEKSSIDHIRENIYDMLIMAVDEPELANDESFMEELTQAFTMRQSLIQLNKLYDA
jgi:hypothetical protein